MPLPVRSFGVGNGDVREVAVLLVPVEAVPVYEFVGDVEAGIGRFEVCGSPAGLVDERNR